MIYLTEEDKNKIQYDGWNKVTRLNLSSGSYYAKFKGNNGAFRELFGKKIFDIIGISTPEYMYIADKKCILSSDLNQTYENFIFAEELDDITNMSVLYELLKQFKNSDELTTAVNIMHFIDILFCNTDRHSSNYGFAVKDDGTAKLVVFDNELMLEDFTHATRPVSFSTNSHLTFTEYSKECEYKYFLETLSEEQKQLISYYLQKLDLKTVYAIINSIERESGCKLKNKNKLFLKYIKNYIMLYKCTMVESRKSPKNLENKVKTKKEKQID